MDKISVGVFDSGIGGLSVAQAIERQFPELVVHFRNDRQHLPYGSRTPEQIYPLVLPILQDLERMGCQVIVIACNTVTTTLIPKLRRQIKVPLIGIEPMIKPATAVTKSGIIAVCATPTTLQSSRYTQLKEQFAKGMTVIEPDCSNWSAMIESNTLNRQQITRQIQDVCRAGSDVIVLGCTHYHWIEKDIQAVASGKAVVIQPEAAIIRQLKRVLTTQ